MRPISGRTLTDIGVIRLVESHPGHPRGGHNAASRDRLIA